MKNASVCRFLCALFLGFLLSFVTAASAANTLNYQGRVISGGTAFTGSGQFKFALVSADGSTVYWKNDGTTDSAAPTSAVPLTVTKGIFSVLLGDTSLSNMAAIPSSVFSNTSMALRIWFNDGVKGFQQVVPDTKFTQFSGSSLTSQSQFNLDLASQYFAAKLAPKFVSNLSYSVHQLRIESLTACTVEFYIDDVLYATGSWGSTMSAPPLTPHIRIITVMPGLLECTVYVDNNIEVLPFRSDLVEGKKLKWRVFNSYGDLTSGNVSPW
jgi:hypothetical protein